MEIDDDTRIDELTNSEMGNHLRQRVQSELYAETIGQLRKWSYDDIKRQSGGYIARFIKQFLERHGLSLSAEDQTDLEGPWTDPSHNRVTSRRDSRGRKQGRTFRQNYR